MDNSYFYQSWLKDPGIFHLDWTILRRVGGRGYLVRVWIVNQVVRLTRYL